MKHCGGCFDLVFLGFLFFVFRVFLVNIVSERMVRVSSFIWSCFSDAGSINKHFSYPLIQQELSNGDGLVL